MRRGEPTLQRRQTVLRWAVLGLMLLVLGLWLVNAWRHSLRVPAETGRTPENSSVYLKLPPASGTQMSTPAIDQSTPVGRRSTAPIAAAVSATSSAASPSAGQAVVAPSPVARSVSASSAKVATDEGSSARLPGTTCTVAGWYAQQGAFGRLSQATDLSNRLRAANYSVCIGNLSANRWYRVLVGPLPDRQAAAAVAARIHKDGLTRDLGYPQYWSPPE